MSSSAVMAPTGFDRFELHASLLRGVRALGFENPRPIQVDTIPAGLAGRDVLGLAQTGTGKTAAFALPALHRILTEPRRGHRVLILAPTRELATQIEQEILALSRFTGVRTVTIFGGVSANNQIKALRREPEIIVGCPGRVLDLMQQKVLRLDGIETLVLDEADHMFDMGFLPGIRRILAALPKRRQNLLFSATMPEEVRGLANEILQKPHVVELARTAPAETIDHALIMVAENRKRDLLDHVLGLEECSSAIVFTRTKHRAKRLADQLSKAGHRAVGLQGNLSQNQRDRAMKGFRTGKFKILVATDIVARGIDVTGVSHVVNFDVPNTPEAYTHRIGRTGRAEREGVACTFVTEADHDWVRATERKIGAPIARREVDGFSLVASALATTDRVSKPARAPRQGRPKQERSQQARRQEGRAQGGRAQGGRTQDGRGQESRSSSPSRPGQQKGRPRARAAAAPLPIPGTGSGEAPRSENAARSPRSAVDGRAGRRGRRPRRRRVA